MRRHFASNASIVAFIAHTAIASSAFAGTTLFVDANSGGVPNGVSWCTAFTDLQSAIAAAVSGDAIRVAGGEYKPDQGSGQTSGDRTASFALNSGVVLLGGYAGCGAANPDARDFVAFETILSGDLGGDDAPEFANRTDNSYHVVLYDDPNASGVVLDGFTVTAGHADGTGPVGTITNQGAGIHIRGGSLKCIPGGPTIRNCTIRDNWSLHHGAVNDHGLGTVIEDNTFRDNWASHHGAGLMIQSGSPRVTRCTFINNATSGRGGGAWTGHDDDPSCPATSEPIFTDCSFSNNQAQRGGGIYNQLNKATVLDSSFDDNVATASSESAAGGGIYNLFGETFVSNCTFNNNVATSDGPVTSDYFAGAAIWDQAGKIVVVDSTFNGNYGGANKGSGGAIRSQDGLYMLLKGCSFQNNTAPDLSGAVHIYAGPEGSIAMIVSCTFDRNSSGQGGAIMSFVNLGTVTITNSIFTHNFAETDGGAISLVRAGPVSVSNCLFVGNRAGNRGGAILHNDGALSVANSTFYDNSENAVTTFKRVRPTEATISNCILWGNLAAGVVSEPAQIKVGLNSEAIVHHSCVDGWTGSLGGIGNFGDDPLFWNELTNNFRLQASSPCINTGDNGAVPTDEPDLDGDGQTAEPLPFDLDNSDRFVEGTVDRGAYEADGFCPPGTFSVTGEEPCDPCPAGEFQPNAGGTECLPCAPGTFAATTGNAICSPCPAETFQSTLGAVACDPCACDDSDVCTTNGCNAVDGSCENEAIGGCTIPTISEWGVLAMSLMLLTIGTIVMRQRASAA